jgi:signal transduction histidine kinase
VVKHAGPAAARVRVAYAQGEVVVEVADDGPGVAAADGAGSGIAGMRERVAAVGGELAAGPGPGGGFTVRARLPR